MKILHEGDPDKLNHVLQFTCENCGCIWEADNSEYIYGYEACIMSCPYCNNVGVRGKEKQEK